MPQDVWQCSKQSVNWLNNYYFINNCKRDTFIGISFAMFIVKIAYD